MSLIPFSNSGCRVQLVAITPVLTTDVIDFGSAARTAVAGITGWSFQESFETVKYRTCESSTTAQGKVLSQNARGGTIDFSGQMNGICDITDEPFFTQGASALVDLIRKKGASGSQVGYAAVKVSFRNYQAGAKVDDAGTQLFTVEFDIDSALPAMTSNIT